MTLKQMIADYADAVLSVRVERGKRAREDALAAGAARPLAWQGKRLYWHTSEEYEDARYQYLVIDYLARISAKLKEKDAHS